MRITVTLDDEQVKRAMFYTGIDEKSALLREALTRLIQREAARRLALLGGTEPGREADPAPPHAEVTLVDTSVWIDHAQRAEELLVDLLQCEEVYSHAYVAGELAMGSFREREDMLLMHSEIPQALLVEPAELLVFVRRNRLHGHGIGYIDAHLLASIQLMENTQLWTRDKRLVETARLLKLPCIAEYAN